MRTISILGIQHTSAADQAAIRSVHSDIRFTDAGGWFDGELRDTWPDFTCTRYLAPEATGHGTLAERNDLLRVAEIILGGWPYPKDLRSRAQSLKWFHQRNAGASNLIHGDLWKSDVVVSTGRGAGNSRAIAEYTIAGLLYFAKSLHRPAQEKTDRSLDHRAYQPLLLAGKTLCVVGAGGIGRQIALLASGLGMKVLGIRRNPSSQGALPAGFSAIGGTADIDDYLEQSDCVAVACQLTEETTHLFNRKSFAKMKTGAILVNVARGEIVDENALLDALDTGQLRGAVLDVYDGEFFHEPPARLWDHPAVMITPHVSASDDQNTSTAMDVFCRNIAAYIEDRPMENVIDWERGY